jgi:hypothetical protein
VADLLTGALPPVTLADQIRAVEREIAMRERVYPRWVGTGTMKPATADEEIRRMKAVLAILKALAQADAPIDPLAGKRAVVCYFETDEDRDEFVAAVREVKPNMRSVNLP